MAINVILLGAVVEIAGIVEKIVVWHASSASKGGGYALKEIGIPICTGNA